MDACHYHHRLPVRWSCPGCHTPFCATCVPGGDGNFPPDEPRCVLCRTPLMYQPPANTKTPFWQISARFFIYPMKGQAVLLVLLGALLQGAAPDGLLGLLLNILFYAMVIRFSLHVVELLAEDNWTPPALSSVMLGQEENLFLKQIGVYVGFTALGLSAASVHPLLGLAYLAFAGLALPASIMVLAMSRSALRALNPILLAQVMLGIGWSYLLLWLCFSVVTSGPFIVAAWLPEEQNNALFSALLGATSCYFAVVSHAMMGYVLFSRAESLGIIDEPERGETLLESDYFSQQALGQSTVLIRAQRLNEAREVLNRALARQSQDLALHQRMQRLLSLLGDRQAMQAHLEVYLNLLLQQGQGGKAVEALQRARQQQVDLLPHDARLRHQLAEHAYRQNRHELANTLLLGLHQQAPHYPALAQAYLLLARIQAEGLGQLGNAEKLLGFVLKRAAGTSTAHEAQAFATVLAGLRRSTVAN